MQDVVGVRLLALGVFAGSYVGLSLARLPPFRVDRTGVAIIGAVAMVPAGVIDWNGKPVTPGGG